jgi:hypothetical protein
MQAIEFKTHLKNGKIYLPISYQHWQEGKTIKVILLADEETENLAKPKKQPTINRHAGKIKLNQDPLEFQRTIRDEWT